MAQGKKTNKKAVVPSEPVLETAPYIGLSDARMQKTRMRIRDQLAETNGNMEAELLVQDTALENGFNVTTTLTMTKTDMANSAAVLVGMKTLWQGISPMTSKTDTKLIDNLDTAIVKLGSMAEMKIKAFTPDHRVVYLFQCICMLFLIYFFLIR